jgi:hypothetical protein
MLVGCRANFWPLHADQLLKPLPSEYSCGDLPVTEDILIACYAVDIAVRHDLRLKPVSRDM